MIRNGEIYGIDTPVKITSTNTFENIYQQLKPEQKLVRIHKLNRKKIEFFVPILNNGIMDRIWVPLIKYEKMRIEELLNTSNIQPIMTKDMSNIIKIQKENEEPIILKEATRK